MHSFVLATEALAALLCLGSYCARTHRGITFVAAAGVLCWAAHFALKQAWTPSVLSFVMALRILAGAWVVDMGRTQRWWATGIAALLTAGGAWWTWQGWVSVPSTAATLFTSWVGMHLKLPALRWALLLADGLWLLNGWVVQSYVACGCSLVGMGLNSWMLWRSRNAGQSAGPSLGRVDRRSAMKKVAPCGSDLLNEVRADALSRASWP